MHEAGDAAGDLASTERESEREREYPYKMYVCNYLGMQGRPRPRQRFAVAGCRLKLWEPPAAISGFLPAQRPDKKAPFLQQL